MATIYNTDLSKELIDGAKIQQNRDIIPNQIADKVVPVMEVNPKLLRRTNASIKGATITAGASIIITTPTSRDFFITGYEVSYIKDSLNDHATGSANILIGFVDGATITICTLATQTLTAQMGNITFTFANPLKIDRGTALSIGGVTIGSGVFSRALIIYGYYVDNPNA